MDLDRRWCEKLDNWFIDLVLIGVSISSTMSKICVLCCYCIPSEAMGTRAGDLNGTASGAVMTAYSYSHARRISQRALEPLSSDVQRSLGSSHQWADEKGRWTNEKAALPSSHLAAHTFHIFHYFSGLLLFCWPIISTAAAGWQRRKPQYLNHPPWLPPHS